MARETVLSLGTAVPASVRKDYGNEDRIPAVG